MGCPTLNCVKVKSSNDYALTLNDIKTNKIKEGQVQMSLSPVNEPI